MKTQTLYSCSRCGAQAQKWSGRSNKKILDASLTWPKNAWYSEDAMESMYTTQLLKEGETFVAYCPEFDLSSCGTSADAARANLHEALSLFIGEARRMGTLENILRESGYRAKGDQWEAPEFIGVERSAFAV